MRFAGLEVMERFHNRPGLRFLLLLSYLLTHLATGATNNFAEASGIRLGNAVSLRNFYPLTSNPFHMDWLF